MKLIIEIDESLLDGIKSDDFDFARRVVKNFQGTIASAIQNGTPIPDNATNGDMIKVMFDVTEEDFYDEDRMVDVYGLDRTDDPSTFYADWWNALYKR